MSVDDIVKVRDGQCRLLNFCIEHGTAPEIASARESMAAFERLIAEPKVAPAFPQSHPLSNGEPGMPLRAYIAGQFLGNLSLEYVSGGYDNEGIANASVELADALIERLKRP